MLFKYLPMNQNSKKQSDEIQKLIVDIIEKKNSDC